MIFKAESLIPEGQIYLQDLNARFFYLLKIKFQTLVFFKRKFFHENFFITFLIFIFSKDVFS